MKVYYPLLLLVLIGCWAPNSGAQESIPVSIVRTVRAPIVEEIALTGNLRARRVSRLSAEVDGIVEQMYVDDGDRVNKGDTILTLDSELATISVARAAAGVTEAQARHKESQRRYDELTELAKKRHVPQTNVEAARAEIDITRATLAQASAARREQQALLDRHTVYAPFDGVVQEKLVEVGQWIETNTTLVEVVETQHLRLEVPVPQFYFSRVQPGTPAAVRFDALPEQIFDAAVTMAIPVSNSAARTFPIRIDLNNAHGLLAPGMSARVTLQISDDTQARALIVPQDAVVQTADGTKTVWTIEIEDGITKARPTAIETGRAYHDNIEVLSGDIEAGTPVVVRGNEILRPGQIVTVAEEKPMDI